jgi:acyl carrier protein
MTDDVEIRVKAIIVKYMDVDPLVLTADAGLADDLGADSLEIMEVVTALEEEFNIEIGDADIDNLKTVGDAVRYVQSALDGMSTS